MLNILKQYNILLFTTLNSVAKLFYLWLTVLLVCRLTSFLLGGWLFLSWLLLSSEGSQKPAKGLTS